MSLKTAEKVLREALDLLDHNDQHLAAVHVATALDLLVRPLESADAEHPVPRLISMK